MKGIKKEFICKVKKIRKDYNFNFSIKRHRDEKLLEIFKTIKTIESEMIIGMIKFKNLGDKIVGLNIKSCNELFVYQNDILTFTFDDNKINIKEKEK